ncbi:hypothetical protein KRR40_29440 [Niabella defluvii]|nr:hypothetical protein KRR40_29440 [Niabella sp. I65]
MLSWADSVLTAQADRKAILVCHSMLGKPKGTTSGDKPGAGDNSLQSNFTKQGKGIYEMAKNHGNVFLMLGGHIAGKATGKIPIMVTPLKLTFQIINQGKVSPTAVQKIVMAAMVPCG